MGELIDAAPDEPLLPAGYFGDGTGAAAACVRASVGLDETVGA